MKAQFKYEVVLVTDSNYVSMFESTIREECKSFKMKNRGVGKLYIKVKELVKC